MALPEGFEPPTPAFVAQYSNPLSYGSINICMNDFCVDLNINIPLFKVDVLSHYYKRIPHSRVNLDFLNPAIIDLFTSNNLEITLCEAFYRKPTDIIHDTVHKDAMHITDATKINWVFGGDDTMMNWYKPINPIFNVNHSQIGVEYINYDRSNLSLIHSQRVGFPSLVQVGIPHDITMGLTDRLCISTFFKEKGSTEYIAFSNAIKLFNNFI